uniref:Rx N-terminal domain-containing protein n=1 Tax=Fagus sylvatica TaxID=28930 RepID=A0A2N9G3D8_FAGSY
MAEGLVTDLIKQLASIAVREAEQEIRLVIGVDEEVQKLKDSLRTVKAVLNDAEKRQVTEEAVKLWLEKLKDTCYEMDDVVDEWNTAMIKSEIQKHEEENAENALAVMKKVCSFIPSPSCCFRQVDKLVLRHDIAHKIKELNGKLDAIVTERVRYGFELTTRGNAPEDDLVNILLGKGSEEERSPHVISLVGMGGIGKTTLAQLAYNDPKMMCGLKTPHCGSHSDLHSEMVAQGSRILATTRKSRVAEMMGSLKTSESMINLEMLSEEDCWLVFRKIAFLDRDPNQCEQLEDLGRKIAKKCKGLPLAAKTLGSLMRFQRNVREAENAQLKNKIHLHTLELEYLPMREYYDLVLNAVRATSKLGIFIIDGFEGGSLTTSPNWMISLTKLKTLRLMGLDVECLPSLGKLPTLERLEIRSLNSLKKVGVEFLGIESENKKEDNMQIFPNLKSLEFKHLEKWEEWIGIGGMREEEEDSNITIMPRLQRLVICGCPYLKSLPDFLRTIPLKELEINYSSILHKRCERGTGEEWPKISHIPNIKIDGKDVQRDGQEVKSEFDSSESNEEEYDREEDNEEEFDKEEYLVSVDKVHPRLDSA